MQIYGMSKKQLSTCYYAFTEECRNLQDPSRASIFTNNRKQTQSDIVKHWTDWVKLLHICNNRVFCMKLLPQRGPNRLWSKLGICGICGKTISLDPLFCEVCCKWNGILMVKDVDHNHHWGLLTAQISLTFSCHLFLFAIVLGKSCRQHSVSAHSWWICFF